MLARNRLITSSSTNITHLDNFERRIPTNVAQPRSRTIRLDRVDHEKSTVQYNDRRSIIPYNPAIMAQSIVGSRVPGWLYIRNVASPRREHASELLDSKEAIDISVLRHFDLDLFWNSIIDHGPLAH